MQAYKIFTKICLNNWHYIDRRVLTMNESINFFTGHSGSGKSTVIDAMQIVLYANTDGRGFFNKAAADDSDRSLIEYLRGMINIGENNQISYRRNKNFSTTIVLELAQSVTGEKECIGVAFDVETASNEIGRMFFWHRGGLLEGDYRTGSRTMTISEIREALQKGFSKEDYFYTSNNERFRRNLYDVYLGGLDMEKFPRLFKRAIPFRMNIRLEDFVKEYICMEQDIHIEDMQESVTLYGRMCRKLEAAKKEIEELEEIGGQYQAFLLQKKELEFSRFCRDKLRILKLEEEIDGLQEQLRLWKEDLTLLEEKKLEQSALSKELQKSSEEINLKLSDTGYALLEERLRNAEETLSHLRRSEEKWSLVSRRLGSWEQVDSVSNQALNDIEKFQAGKITGEEILRLKKALSEVEAETDAEQRETAAEIRSISKETKLLEDELAELRMGQSSYPRELSDAKSELERGLYERYGRHIPVRILAELLEIRNEKWRNAIEGYLNRNKLTLIVEPAYVKDAFELYEGLDAKKYWRVSLADTERVLEQEQPARTGSLAEEVEARENYVRAFVNYLLGNVMKCESTKELRSCRVGVTADCRLYQNFQLRRLNPEQYTRYAYIGEKSRKQRQKELSAQLEKLEKRLERYRKAEREAREILGKEFLKDSVEEYQTLISDLKEKKQKEKEQERLRVQMEELSSGIVEELKERRRELEERKEAAKAELEELGRQIWKKEESIEKGKETLLEKHQGLQAMVHELRSSEEEEERFAACLKETKEERRSLRYDRLLEEADAAIEKTEDS